MRKTLTSIIASQQFGLVLVILALGVVLSVFAGEFNGRNTFLNADTLLQVLTDGSFIAIMAVGMTAVIVSGGIDLSVGAVYALAGVTVGLLFRSHPDVGLGMVPVGLAVALGVGGLCGMVNGWLIIGLGVHPFIITLGTMLVYRGIAFVTTRAESILYPQVFTDVLKSTLGLPDQLYPVPMLAMVATAVLGWLFLQRTVLGRYVFAIGGNLLAAQYAGVRVNPVLVRVYLFSGMAAGFAAFLGASYYGSASSGDGTGYELYVVAAAVVGGASLAGGRGSAIGAMLGALLIALMRQSVRTLRFDQNYEQIIIGTAIVVAVFLDTLSRRLGAARARRATLPPEPTPS